LDRWCRLFRILSIPLFVSSFLLAAPPFKRAGDILRSHNQRLIHDRQNRSLYDSNNSSYTRPATVDTRDSASPGGACVVIDRVDTSEITLIEKSRLDDIVSPLLRKCDTIDSINAVIDSINRIYLNRGYITSAAYLEPQDLSDGTLVISALEGRIESVVGDGIYTGFLFYHARERHLNLRDLEAAMEPLNRFRAYRTAMELYPGKKIGYSRIVLHQERISSQIYGSGGFNNFGTKSTGRFQFDGDIFWENPLGVNGLLHMNFNMAKRGGRPDGARSYNANYSVPAGRNLLEFSVSGFRYLRMIEGVNKLYRSEGRTRSLSVGMKRRVYRSRHFGGKVELSLAREISDNYLAGVHLALSATTLNILSIGYRQEFFFKNCEGYLNIRYSRGLGGPGSRTPPMREESFDKVVVEAGLLSEFDAIEGVSPLRYTLSFYAQSASKMVVPSQQIGVGGPYSVRGFMSEGALSGASGFYLRNELSTRMATSAGVFAPYMALDVGAVKHDSFSYGGSICGGALGLRLKLGHLFADISYSAPLRYPSSFPAKERFAGVSLRYNF